MDDNGILRCAGEGETMPAAAAAARKKCTMDERTGAEERRDGGAPPKRRRKMKQEYRWAHPSQGLLFGAIQVMRRCVIKK